MGFESSNLAKDIVEHYKFDLGKISHAISVLNDFLSLLTDYDLGLLNDPRASLEERLQLIKSYISDPELVILLELLVQKFKLPLLPQLVEELRKDYDELAGISNVIVETGMPLAASEISSLQQRLENSLKRKIRLEQFIDPGIKLGARLRIGSFVFSTAIRDLLNSFRREGAHIPVSTDLPSNWFSLLIREKLGGLIHRDEGIITKISGSIVTVFGLESAVYKGDVFFEICEKNEVRGIVQDLLPNQVKVLLLDPVQALTFGSKAITTGKLLKIPVGERVVGRILDGIGRPIDGKGPIGNGPEGDIFRDPPQILDRQSVREPLLTGNKIIDLLFPIGHGQRMAGMADTQTGLTTIGVDAIINQGKSTSPVYCFYIAIGQSDRSVAQVIETLEKYGAMRYTTVIVAKPEDPVALKYLAPLTGCAMGEYWMYNGGRSLAVYDTLSVHAEAYRSICLDLERPSGRETYPSDIFSIHGNLLERAGQLKSELGGGSLTAIPFVRIIESDYTTYIPTNIISITDGQFFIFKDLWSAGRRPAIDFGLSVSRVGSDAQHNIIAKLSSSFSILLADWDEIEKEASTDLDVESRRVLERGRRGIKMLEQGPHEMITSEELALMSQAILGGWLDNVPIENIRKTLGDLVKHYSLVGMPEMTVESLDLAIKKFMKK